MPKLGHHYMSNGHLYKKLYFDIDRIANPFSEDKELSMYDMPVKSNTRIYWIAKEYFIEDAKHISILDIHKYEWHILSRFFYGIYNVRENKWWIRHSWIPIDEFCIQIWMVEKQFYDVKIWNEKMIFADKENIKKWKDIRYRNRFMNSHRTCTPLKEFPEVLKAIWASGSLMKTLIIDYRTYYSWCEWDNDRFQRRLKKLKSVKNDPDRERLRYYPGSKCTIQYEREFWYKPEERFMRKYKMVLNQIWKEYRERINNYKKND